MNDPQEGIFSAGSCAYVCGEGGGGTEQEGGAHILPSQRSPGCDGQSQPQACSCLGSWAKGTHVFPANPLWVVYQDTT